MELQALRRLRDEWRARKAAGTSLPRHSEPPAEPVGIAEDRVRDNSPSKEQSKPVKSGLPSDYRPAESELKKYLEKWDSLNIYVEHEKALEMIFRQDPVFMLNTDIRHVIIKCSVLNDFYATNIYQIEPIASAIVSIEGFDDMVREGNPDLVERIASIEGVKNRNYSFATKYCSHHNPEAYPIYDRYVADVLMFLRKKYPDIMPFRKRDELKDYTTFVSAIEAVRQHFGLENYSYKDIDRYLWQLGKDYYNPYVKS